MLYWYAELNVPSVDSCSLFMELSLNSKSSIVSTFAFGCENLIKKVIEVKLNNWFLFWTTYCENVPDKDGNPLPTIFPTEPIMLGRNRTKSAVLTTCSPMNNGHISFFNPEI